MMFQRYSDGTRLCLISLFSFWLVACGGGGSSESEDPEVVRFNNGYASTALKTTAVETSAKCPFGGIEIHTGVDVNKNGVLDQDEINNTQEICHISEDLVKAEVEQLPAESECVNGGNRLTIGYDGNNNEVIDPDEVNQSLLFCNQEITTPLAMAVYRYDVIPEGEDCQYGGQARQVGLDLNGNEKLDNDEITSSEFKCITDNSAISQSPYYYSYDYCDSVYCDENDVPEIILMQGVSGLRAVGRVYDDGVGNVTVTTDANAPDWLAVSLSDAISYDTYYDYTTHQYVTAAYYNIWVDQSAAPADAIGKTYEVTLTVSDGQVSFDIERRFSVVKPIRMALDKSSLSVTESGDGDTKTAYVKVTFDQALPASALRYSTSHTGNYIDIERVLADETVEYYSSDDIEVKWVSSDFFEGQTQATLRVDVKDDSFPEDTENYRVVIHFPSYSENSSLFIVDSSLDVSIEDDGDQEITATIALDSTRLTEGTATDSGDQYTLLPFTITFSPAIPQDGSISIDISGLTNNDSANNDVGIACDYYCSNSYYLYLAKGTTEYSGTIYIKADAHNEADETFKIELGSRSSFEVAGLSAEFTVVDDDEEPVIGFAESTMDYYYGERLVNVRITLDAATYENVTFSLAKGADDTALEGVHYDFAVSTPITFRPGKIYFDLPILVHGVEFEGSQIEANLTLKDVSGAQSNDAAQTIKLIFDKIEPYSASVSSFVVPITTLDSSCSGYCDSSSYYYDHTSNETLNLSDDAYVYKVGTVDSGYAIDGEVAIGGRDFFVAKFDLDKNLIWAKQFGTSGYDSISSKFFFSQSGGLMIRGGNSLYHISSSGEVSNMTLDLSGYYSLRGIKQDALGNTYVLIDYSYSYYGTYDRDSDGAWSNMLLLKYDTDFNLSWAAEDFSAIQAAHGGLDIDILSLELTEAGVPFVFARTYGQTFLGKQAIGAYYSYDYAAFSFNAANGAARSYERFGSTGYDDGNVTTVPYEDNQVLVHYGVDSGDIVGGQTANNSLRTSQVVFDSAGILSSQKLIASSYESSYSPRVVVRSSDDRYFALGWISYNSFGIAILDDSLETIISRVLTSNSYDSPSVQSPILAEDGGYYLIDSDSTIRKITPNLNFRY